MFQRRFEHPSKMCTSLYLCSEIGEHDRSLHTVEYLSVADVLKWRPATDTENTLLLLGSAK